MDFYERIGPAALGSRLRRLGDRLAEDAKPVYGLYGTEMEPRWFPVVFLLGQKDKQSVSMIAEAIGHTHASISQITRDMVQRGYASLTKSKGDGRKTVVSLTPKGRVAAAKLVNQCSDVSLAVDSLQAEMGADLWTTLARAEAVLAHRGLYERVIRARALRLCGVAIVDYDPSHAAAFDELNRAWITRYFAIEETDRRMLENPDSAILAPGGFILIAIREDRAVGTCALVPQGKDCFELAKMAVAPECQGTGIGTQLGCAAIARAQAAGARKLYLESNRRLAPAINVYRKLGFVEVQGHHSPYARADIFMEMRLDQH
jgi:DNA-binding MarR family transcriptional regulator/N-acetylglutamate synthase-like GNAT family acetyltransferase